MTQDTVLDNRFDLASGEQVTVTVQSVQCNCDTTAGYDGKGLPRQHHIPDVYTFPVTGNLNDLNWFVCSCTFPQNTPITAHYTIQVSSNVGGTFSVTPLYMEEGNRTFQLRFRIQ